MSSVPANIYSDANAASLTLNSETVVIAIVVTALVCAASMMLAAKVLVRQEDTDAIIKSGFYK